MSQYLVRYLKERGLVSVGAVALLAPDAEQFSRTLVSFLESGWAGSVTYKLTPEELCIAQANMKYLRELCLEEQETAALASRVSAAVAAIPSVPGPAASNKPPSDLEAGEWQKMITRYNS